MAHKIEQFNFFKEVVSVPDATSDVSEPACTDTVSQFQTPVILEIEHDSELTAGGENYTVGVHGHLAQGRRPQVALLTPQTELKVKESKTKLCPTTMPSRTHLRTQV